MPWHQEPKKDVTSCDKPWGAAHKRYIHGFPNGETESLPGDERVAREAQRIAVASETSPSVINKRTLVVGFLFGMVEEDMIEPERIRQTGGKLRFFPLLPVKPPEVNTLFLHGTENSIEI